MGCEHCWVSYPDPLPDERVGRIKKCELCGEVGYVPIGVYQNRGRVVVYKCGISGCKNAATMTVKGRRAAHGKRLWVCALHGEPTDV